MIGQKHKVKSLCGSHRSMICDNVLQDTLLGFRRIIAGEVLLKDSQGYYATTFDKLDTGLMDVNRFNNCLRL